MPRARLISPEFWTSESVVDCAPMTRLLLLGLSTFADDFGVLPLRPRTMRMQVFPGDAIDDEQMRAMIDELAAHGLVRRYTVDGVEYLSIVDWAVHQRVGKRARRRYPALASPRDDQGALTAPGEVVPGAGEAEEAVRGSVDSPDHRKTLPGPSVALEAPSASGLSAAADGLGETEEPAADAAWHYAIEYTMRRNWGADLPADLPRHAQRWRDAGRDLDREVLPAIVRVIRWAVDFNEPLRLELVDDAITGAARPVAMAQTMETHSNGRTA